MSPQSKSGGEDDKHISGYEESQPSDWANIWMYEIEPITVNIRNVNVVCNFIPAIALGSYSK